MFNPLSELLDLTELDEMSHAKILQPPIWWGEYYRLEIASPSRYMHGSSYENSSLYLYMNCMLIHTGRFMEACSHVL